MSPACPSTPRAIRRCYGLMAAAGLRAEMTCESFPLAFETGRYLQMIRDPGPP